MIIYAFKVAIFEFVTILTEMIRFGVYWLSFPLRPIIRRYIGYEIEKSGVKIGGESEYDIRVKDGRFWSSIASASVVGFVDSFVDGYIECDNLLDCVARLMKHKFIDQLVSHPYIYINCELRKWINLQAENNSYEGDVKAYEKHVKLIYKWMSVNDMNCCLNFRKATHIEEAAEHAKHLIIRKLKIKKGMKILDINCNYGGLATFIGANVSDVTVVAITASEFCARIALRGCENFDNVKVKQMDYKKIGTLGKFDRIICIEMIEHIGVHNYRKFLNAVHHCLTPNGLFYLQVIGINNCNTAINDVMFSKFHEINISFPRFEELVANLKHTFFVEDWQNNGGCYAKTFAALFQRIQNNKAAIIKEFGERQFRWCQLSCAFLFASFWHRKLQLWQIVLSKEGIVGGYYAES